MAELEIHQEHEHSADPLGKKVGIMAAVLAVLLAVVTIASHRTHTAAIMHKSKSNDQWAYYQATRVKLHTTEVGENMVHLLGAKGEDAEKMLAQYEGQKKKYEEQSEKIQEQAKGADEAGLPFQEGVHLSPEQDVGFAIHAQIVDLVARIRILRAYGGARADLRGDGVARCVRRQTCRRRCGRDRGRHGCRIGCRGRVGQIR